MTNLTAWLRCWIPLRELTLGIFLILISTDGYSQYTSPSSSNTLSNSLRYEVAHSKAALGEQEPVVNQRDTVPEPTGVMLRSVMIPGWGQLTNRQGWKVPVVYGLLAGVTYYSISLHDDYTDYRAAYYNTHSDDQKFGPTPGSIDPEHTAQALREYRNYYRNRRDMAIIGVFLAYGLNVADAYVFAHFRDFDVSDDLSANIGVAPELAPDRSPFVSLSFRLSFN